MKCRTIPDTISLWNAIITNRRDPSSVTLIVDFRIGFQLVSIVMVTHS